MARNATIEDQTTTSACKVQTEVDLLSKELQNLQLQQRKMELISKIEKCKSDIASLQTRTQLMNSSSDGSPRNNPMCNN
ncbi:hypothetical protein KUTeg_011797 [Tegillarca granosa]|uniref:Uncharacterized protein n=1 Tax=Tegillarca granosa TaxID=220873 RepID=A0ABQ9F0Z3_TEGGR|nr:hypothetical protein KUTeg_011797 [Tegillarca granosa]